MPDFTNKVRTHVVIVDDGSGVLIQPAKGDYSYVITAKHVLETVPESGEYKDIDDISVITFSDQTIELANKFISDNFDLAILVTQQRLDLDLQTAISRPEREQSIFYYGYPKNRRSGNYDDRIREFIGKVNETPDGRFSVSLQSRPDWSEISGASGGGIFVEIENQLFLFGIESRYEGSPGREFHGKVVCISMQTIERFIIESGLEKIHPPALNSFLGLVDKTFELYSQADDPENLRFLKNKLHERAAIIGATSEVNPMALYDAYKEELLIKESHIQNLHSEEMWIAYLEFLIISCLIDEKQEIDFSYVKDNSTRRRFLFSACKDNWIWRLMDIFRSDFRGLRKGGKIIVSTGDLNARMQAREPQLSNIIANIGRGRVDGLMVDSAIINPAIEFQVFHLTGLHRFCVLENENDFRRFYAGGVGCGEPELIDFVKGLYNAHI